MNTMEEEMLLCSFIQMLIKSFVIKPCGTPFVYLQVSKGPTGNSCGGPAMTLRFPFSISIIRLFPSISELSK